MKTTSEFETIFLPMRPLLVACLQKKCWLFDVPESCVEDLTHETLVICLEAYRKDAIKTDAKWFALRVAYTLFTRHRVEKARKPEVYADLATVPFYDVPPCMEEEYQSPGHIWAMAALASLTDADRDLLYGRYVGDMSHRELAQATGLEPGQLRNRLDMLREKLRNFNMEEEAHKQAKRRINGAILLRFNDTHQKVIAEVLSHPDTSGRSSARTEVGEKYGMSYNAVKKVMGRYQRAVMAG